MFNKFLKSDEKIIILHKVLLRNVNYFNRCCYLDKIIKENIFEKNEIEEINNILNRILDFDKFVEIIVEDYTKLLFFIKRVINNHHKKNYQSWNDKKNGLFSTDLYKFHSMVSIVIWTLNLIDDEEKLYLEKKHDFNILFDTATSNIDLGIYNNNYATKLFLITSIALNDYEIFINEIDSIQELEFIIINIIEENYKKFIYKKSVNEYFSNSNEFSEWCDNQLNNSKLFNLIWPFILFH